MELFSTSNVIDYWTCKFLSEAHNIIRASTCHFNDETDSLIEHICSSKSCTCSHFDVVSANVIQVGRMYEELSRILVEFDNFRKGAVRYTICPDFCFVRDFVGTRRIVTER